MASTRSRDSRLNRRYSASSGASRPPTSESEGIFDGHYDLGEDEIDDKDDTEELPTRTSVSSRSSKRRPTQVSKRDAALKSEVRSLFNFFFVYIYI
jgi:hypothetical protein